MLSKLYYIDITTILTLMAIGALIGYMLGKRFMDVKMLILLTIVFLVGTFVFLDINQPETALDSLPLKEEVKPKEQVQEDMEELEPASGKGKLVIESSKEE